MLVGFKEGTPLTAMMSLTMRISPAAGVVTNVTGWW